MMLHYPATESPPLGITVRKPTNLAITTPQPLVKGAINHTGFLPERQDWLDTGMKVRPCSSLLALASLRLFTSLLWCCPAASLELSLYPDWARSPVANCMTTKDTLPAPLSSLGSVEFPCRYTVDDFSSLLLNLYLRASSGSLACTT